MVIFDPKDSFFKKIDVKAIQIKSLFELDTIDPSSHILIIAPYAFEQKIEHISVPVIGKQHPGLTNLTQFIKKGGRVLFLEQENFSDFMKGLSLVSHASTLAFPKDLTHPVFKELTLEDFRFWQEDNYVTKMEIRRLSGFGAKALLVSGGLQSLDQSPLVEIPLGLGNIILCQALVGTKYETEPIAQILFRNMIDYPAEFTPRKEKAVVLCQGETQEVFIDTLNRIGVRYDQTVLSLKEEGTETIPLIIIHGGGDLIAASASALQTYLHTPGKRKTLYWHAPDRESFTHMKKALGIEYLSIEPGNGPLTLHCEDQPLFSGIYREDFTYIRDTPYQTGNRDIDLDPGIIEDCVSLRMDTSPANIHDIENWSLDGDIVYVNKEKTAVIFATNGTASDSVYIDRSGLYTLSIVANGTPARGIWPMARISANGKPVAFLQIRGEMWNVCSTMAELPQGDVLFDISFINDFYAQGDDRNLGIDSFSINTKPVATQTINFLTLPGGVVECVITENTRVIIDTIQWPSTVKNRLKGLRYASTLFNNMGASFEEPGTEPDWIPHDVFHKHGEIAYSDKTGNGFALYSAGILKADFFSIKKGNYTVFVRGSSTEVDGVYSKVLVTIGDKNIGEIEIKSLTTDIFRVGTCFLEQGDHVITIAFINDFFKKGHDRNLFFQGIGFEVEN